MIQRMSDGRPNQNIVFCAILKLEFVDKYKDILHRNDDFVYIITIIDDHKIEV